MLTYAEFRTGLTFTEVRWMLRRRRKHVTRHTVLGKWHEIKLRMWEQYNE